MMKILFLPEVIDYFLQLAETLYEKQYVGFEEYALKYSESLFDDIYNNLPNKHKKVAPKYFDKYGKDMFYAVFRKNKNTSWYVFFAIYYTNGETVYFVRYISNNHVVAHYL